MNASVCLATEKNWKRLGVDVSNKLTKRANKQLSQKCFLPYEYFENSQNIKAVSNIVDFILENKIEVFTAIYTIAIKQLIEADICNLPHVQKVLDSYACEMNRELFNFDIPQDERDLLGIIYQSISFEGDKNKKGSYYTPRKITERMTQQVALKKQQSFLDPCCGSGSFLLSINGNPNQLYGTDNDYIAVFICKINLLLKFHNDVFEPQIYYCDFLQDGLFKENIPVLNKRFDYIITNPPWGALCNENNIYEIDSRESFSYFFVKSFSLLQQNGHIRFLFPESILRVKLHRDIREFMLKNGSIESITLYDDLFSGVTTKYIDIQMTNQESTDDIKLYSKKGLIKNVNKNSFYSTENLVFNFQNDIDLDILSQVKGKGIYSLKDSIWALGIVTGNNKEKLSTEKTEASEPIYTGKEILPYVLKKPTKYIVYERANFQQVAKDEIYRAEEKLVYKFISNKLVFAYDDNKSLFLNSANILIPKIPNMSIKTVLAFLNSELYQYLYSVLFAEIKILKGNLIELPFANISVQKDKEISSYVEKIIAGDKSQHNELQNLIYDVFEISEQQKMYIKEKISGTAD